MKRRDFIALIAGRSPRRRMRNAPGWQRESWGYSRPRVNAGQSTLRAMLCGVSLDCLGGGSNEASGCDHRKHVAVIDLRTS